MNVSVDKEFDCPDLQDTLNYLPNYGEQGF